MSDLKNTSTLKATSTTTAAPRWNWKGWIANGRGTSAFSERSQSPRRQRGLVKLRMMSPLASHPAPHARVPAGCLLPSLQGPCNPPSSSPLQTLFSLFPCPTARTHTHTSVHYCNPTCIKLRPLSASMWLFHPHFRPVDFPISTFTGSDIFVLSQRSRNLEFRYSLLTNLPAIIVCHRQPARNED